MTNIFLYSDIITEISQYMIHTNFINFSLVNKLCHKTINKSLDDIDEYKFLHDNKMKVINKNFICNLIVPINLNDITNIVNFYPKYKKYKLYCVKYHHYDILIRIYLNGYITIDKCISHDDAHTKLNNMLLLLQNSNIIDVIPRFKITPKLSNICFFYSKEIHNDIKEIYHGYGYSDGKITFITPHITIYYNDWYDYKINVKYIKFKDFYRFFMCKVIKI